MMDDDVDGITRGEPRKQRRKDKISRGKWAGSSRDWEGGLSPLDEKEKRWV